MLGFIVFASGGIGYAIGEHVGSERIFGEWRKSQDEVRTMMRGLGFCEWATEFRKQNACSVQ